MSLFIALTDGQQPHRPYLHQDLVGVVVGNANSRGEIALDPSDPLSRARDLGAQLFDVRVTDYRLDTVRSNRVWEASLSRTEAARSGCA